jgi:hypothetical protein
VEDLSGEAVRLVAANADGGHDRSRLCPGIR